VTLPPHDQWLTLPRQLSLMQVAHAHPCACPLHCLLSPCNPPSHHLPPTWSSGCPAASQLPSTCPSGLLTQGGRRCWAGGWPHHTGLSADHGCHGYLEAQQHSTRQDMTRQGSIRRSAAQRKAIHRDVMACTKKFVLGRIQRPSVVRRQPAFLNNTRHYSRDTWHY